MQSSDHSGGVPTVICRQSFWLRQTRCDFIIKQLAPCHNDRLAQSMHVNVMNQQNLFASFRNRNKPSVEVSKMHQA